MPIETPRQQAQLARLTAQGWRLDYHDPETHTAHLSKRKAGRASLFCRVDTTGEIVGSGLPLEARLPLHPAPLDRKG